MTVVGGQVAFVPAVPPHEMRDEDWELVFDLNLHYVARAVRVAIRAFLEQPVYGATAVAARSIWSGSSPSGQRCTRSQPASA